MGQLLLPFAGERVSTKTGRERVVKIKEDAALISLLKNHKADAFERGHAGAGDFVFSTEVGKPLHHRNVGKAFTKAATRAGLNVEGQRPLRFHDLRRTYVSDMLGARVDVGDIARQAGHTVDVLLKAYAGCTRDEERLSEQRSAAIASAWEGGAS